MAPMGLPLPVPRGSLALQQALGCAEGNALPGAGRGAFGVSLCCIPRCLCLEKGGIRDRAGQSSSWHWGGKFVKKVLNTDFPGYQKENLCIAFEFNFSIKAFSL